MAQEPTLLAHLVPRVTGQVENAATDALAFILNKSEACRGALDRLLEWKSFEPGPIVRVETQVAEDDQSRPDMVGYDRKGRHRLLVESKFWAGLGKEQASRYFEKLYKDSQSVLLFVCPASRINTLWPEIGRQLEGGEDGVRLEQLDAPKRTKRARVIGANQHVMLISWRRLLDGMSNAVPRDSAVRSDIRQLRGLAKYQDEEAFLPIHPQEFGPAIPRRIRGLHRLIDDLVTQGRSQGWITTEGLRATPQREGYGRYLSFTDIPGWLFLGIDYSLWATSGDTPLWLMMKKKVPVDNGEAPDKTRYPVKYDGSGVFSGYSMVPIHLRTGVEYQHVLNDVVDQIMQLRDVIAKL